MMIYDEVSRVNLPALEDGQLYIYVLVTSSPRLKRRGASFRTWRTVGSRSIIPMY